MQSSEQGKRYTGVILAGGENRRYNGAIKAKLVIDGKPIIEKTLELLKRIFDDILIVTNSSEQFSAYDMYPMVSDIYSKIGPIGGLHAALKAVKTEAIFMVAGDMPFLSEELIRSMITYFGNSGSEVLIPRHNGLDEPLHAIYSTRLLKRLEDFLGSADKFAIRDFLKLAEVEYMIIESGKFSNDPFANVNRPEDLEKLGSTGILK
jgi:molybdopterin-guanine dinucleotide biosynthesis protein A